MRDPQGQRETDSFIKPSDKLHTYIVWGGTVLIARNNEQNGYLAALGDLV